jgi:hypothetical protein
MRGLQHVGTIARDGIEIPSLRNLRACNSNEKRSYSLLLNPQGAAKVNDAEILRDRYSYDPETSEFLWRNPPARARKVHGKIGQPAGTVDKRDGSRQLMLEGRIYPASRLAWLYVHGEWPARQVQYEDPTLPLPTRDRLSNLRLAGEQTEITQDGLRRVLSYDPALGEFRWKVSRKGIRQGALAGGPRKTHEGLRYHYIRIDGIDYPGHRLAWLYVHGSWPIARLSFKNNRPADLRIDNLVEGEFEHGTRQTPTITDAERQTRQARTYRKHDLQRKFGLTEAEYRAMHEAQNGCCAMCGCEETETRGAKVKWLAVDHDHGTGAVRKLLCKLCNMTIGYAREEPKILVAAIAYLAKHGNPEARQVLRQIELGRKAEDAGMVFAGLLSEAA